MPITLQDLQPFISPTATSTLPSYYAGTAPTSGGMPTGGGGDKGFLPNFNFAYSGNNGGIGGIISNPMTNPLAALDPLGAGILGGLFGGDDKPKWQPYVDPATGRYVWTNPRSRNPVPVASVPGASLSPSLPYQKAANQAQALLDIYPYISQAINSQMLPQALSQLSAAQATSPAYAQLMTELYNTYGPQLNAIGNEIMRRNALAQAGTENEVLRGPGTDLVKGAYDLSQIYDKPYYDTRQLGANRLADLLNSIDLSGGLSDTERSEISQGLAREGVRRGTLNAPSASETVANAMRYGEKGYQRTQQAKSNLSTALQNASAFLPASKSGVDVFQVATGRPSQPNPGNAQFTGINKTDSSNSYGLAGNILGNMTQSDIAAANIVANQKDWLDKFNQLASGIGSLTSSASSAAGMLGAFCWVAREVYGADNPKWQTFRKWMLEKAPVWLFQIYADYGSRIAEYIKDKPEIKRKIKQLMDLAIA